MKIMLTPIFGDSQITEYKIGSDGIVKVELVKIKKTPITTSINEQGQEVITEYDIEHIIQDTEYVDLSNVEEGKEYEKPSDYIQNVRNINGEAQFEIVNFILEDATHEERFPEWQDVEFEDFEIPEEAEIIQLEEIVIPEPAPDPLLQMRAENKALEVRLETIKRQAEDDRKQNEATTLALLELMMSLI